MNTIKAGKHLYLLIDFSSYAFTCDILESLQSIWNILGILQRLSRFPAVIEWLPVIHFFHHRPAECVN